MDISAIINEKLERLNQESIGSGRFPISVYRLQFNPAFTFRDAEALVSYLDDLGITDCYASPYFKARRGSQHGYDISDQNSLNPEIGSAEEYKKFVSQLQKHDMGQILDFVPNHMSIFENSKWQDLLENGPSSIYARFFDVDWKPAKAELDQKVLLPILEELYGIILERGQITLGYAAGTFSILYHDYRMPVGPKTAVSVLESSLGRLRELIAESELDYLEMQSLITACKNLPERSEIEPHRMMERHREKEIVKRRLADLCRRNKDVESSINKTVKIINGVAGNSQSFIKLHELLEKQAYRLSFWKVATEEINYRRFFDINELVALRMEDPVVFEETHRLVRQLFGQGLIAGIRIDHVDGLFDPAGYLHHLQKDCWLERAALQLKADPELSDCTLELIKRNLTDQLDRDPGLIPCFNFPPVYLVVEKILGENESLNCKWPVAGTTGYEFAAGLNQLFIECRHARALLNAYRGFTGSGLSFDDIAYQCKNLVMRTSMAGEVNMLAHLLNKISERSWQYRDFTLNSLRDAIREIIACFPVYRTYIDFYSGSVEENDRAVIDKAVDDAKGRNPVVSSAVFDFVKGALLLQFPVGMHKSGRDEQRLFVMRFQQFTGPVMAKGVEDTAFYIYNPLVSLNEVGNNPRLFGAPAAAFHRQNIARRQASPRSFSSTSTHDSKRGEDVRARINVLSEIPADWRSALVRWSRINQNHKIIFGSGFAPDRNDEYLLYQTLLGTYPLGRMIKKDLADYQRRIRDYMLKAVKEAKVHTSWISPNMIYEEGLTAFIEKILDPSPSNPFLADFKSLNQVVAICGMYNSLSQVVLKIFSPGVPDIYQGNELWAYNLTDPDNRRPVNYAQYIRILHGLMKQAANSTGLSVMAEKLLSEIEDGKIKFYVSWKCLNYRRDNPVLFDGFYSPLKVVGLQKDHICAFAWKKESQMLIVAVPRLLVSLTQQAKVQPLGEQGWGNTTIIIPRKLGRVRYRNIFTSETISGVDQRQGSALAISEAFKIFPVAALESY